jgi:curli production assembly/transport component CsgF
MMKKIAQYFMILFISFFSFQIAAQDLVYKPKNPAFGGDTFNYNWLLSSATAQDQTTDPDAEERSSFFQEEGSQLDNFTESLNRQILSQLSRSLVNAQFGENGLEQGSYTIGDFDIKVEDIGEGLSVTIFDASTGSETQIIIPYY